VRIYSSTTNQVADRVLDRNAGTHRYDCYLQDRENNMKIHAHSFENIEDAACFLINNPGSGIRMQPGSAIISSHIVIARDELED
jgi:hypothetical protein